MGSKAVVAKGSCGTGPITIASVVLHAPGIQRLAQNNFTEIRDPHGKVKTVNWAIALGPNPHRLSYSGIEFFPVTLDDAEATPGHHSWRRLRLGPTPKPHGWKTLRDHPLAKCSCHRD